MTTELPQTAPGHWDTPEGREIAVDYLTKDRANLCMGKVSDFHLANKQYLEDISVGTVTFQSAIAMQTAAKERIRWLSVQLAAANQKLAATGDSSAAGWIVGNSAGTKWRTWDGGVPDWTDDREKATRYARRIDAENVHAEDEDAWRIEPYVIDPHTAASQATDASGWRPMDTAPTDGTEVIVRIREKVIRLGWYFKRSSRTEGWCDESGKAIEPIAWMPMPLATLSPQISGEEMRLRELLSTAVDDHDCHQGPATLPCHWTNQARTLLGRDGA